MDGRLLQRFADMMANCADICDICHIMSKCRYLWLESILVEMCQGLWKNIDFGAILVDICRYMSIFVDICQFAFFGVCTSIC